MQTSTEEFCWPENMGGGGDELQQVKLGPRTSQLCFNDVCDLIKQSDDHGEMIKQSIDNWQLQQVHTLADIRSQLSLPSSSSISL